MQTLDYDPSERPTVDEFEIIETYGPREDIDQFRAKIEERGEIVMEIPCLNGTVFFMRYGYFPKGHPHALKPLESPIVD